MRYAYIVLATVVAGFSGGAVAAIASNDAAPPTPRPCTTPAPHQLLPTMPPCRTPTPMPTPTAMATPSIAPMPSIAP